MTGLSPRCAALLEVLRSALQAADALSPGERYVVLSALVADIRSRNPLLLGAPQ